MMWLVFGLRAGVKGWLQGLRDPACRIFWRLAEAYRRYPRFLPVWISAGELRIHVADAASFLSTYRELFVERIYDFESAEKEPVILDFGANIGLSAIFFKKRYPAARVFAYEADPDIYCFLKENLVENGCGDCQTFAAAVLDRDGECCFCSDHADGGHIDGEGAGEIRVPALNAASILAQHPRIELLKMDIEGAENCVIPAIESELHRVNYIFVEFHRRRGEAGALHHVINVLEHAGFRLTIHDIGARRRSPFCADSNADKQEFDMQLNIWGSRR